jgi:PadR family transcriptional regulator, regulatory protein PadR
MGAISEMSDDVLRAEEGSLYPALHRMEEAGWIRAEWIVKDTGPPGAHLRADGAGQETITR